jgi:hypothetical protein
VVLCPGGGFRRVNLQHEGADFAEWFDQQNVSLAVLKYRLPEGDRDRPIADVTKACRILRGGINGISFRKIGCMGASIGGYMAAYAAITGLADFHSFRWMSLKTFGQNAIKIAGKNLTGSKLPCALLIFYLALMGNTLLNNILDQLTEDCQIIGFDRKILYLMKQPANIYAVPKSNL